MVFRRNRNVIALIGATALCGYLTQGVWSRGEVEFTRPAPPALPSVDVRAGLSTAYVVLPVDLARVARRAEEAFAMRLPAAESAPPAPCNPRRGAAADCGPRLEGAVSRAGPIEAVGQGSIVRLRIPVRIDGPAAAPGAAERQPADLVMAFPFSVRFNNAAGNAAGFEIAQYEDAAADGGAAAARITRQLEARLKPVVAAAIEELRIVLSRLPVKTATERAWAALVQPIELGKGSGLWLRGNAESIGAGELVTAGGSTIYRIGIASRLAVGEADRGAGLPVKRAPVYSQATRTEGSRIRMAVPVPLEPLQQAATLAFKAAGPLETRADRFSTPVRVLVKGTRVYPAARQIAVELDVEATPVGGSAVAGKAHLVGRPVLDTASGVLTLADVTFPPAAPRDPGAPRAAASGAPRLGPEPFASRLIAAARLDVASNATDAVPRAMHLLNQRLDERLVLAARLAKAEPSAIETSRDGAHLVLDLVGELLLHYDGPEERLAVTMGQPEKSGELRTSAGAAVGAAAATTTAAAAATAAAVGKRSRTERPERAERRRPAVVARPAIRRPSARVAATAKTPFVAPW